MATTWPPGSQHAAEQAEINQLIGPPSLRSEDDPAAAGVVGDDIGQGEAEIVVPGIENVHRGEDGFGRGQHAGHRGGRRYVATKQERDFRLRARVDQAAAVHRAAIINDHAAGDPAVKRLGHVHGFLLGPAGQAELGPGQLLARVQLGLHEFPLRRVGRLDIDVGMAVGERRDRGPRFGGRNELGRHVLGLDHVRLPSPENRAVTVPR